MSGRGAPSLPSLLHYCCWSLNGHLLCASAPGTHRAVTDDHSHFTDEETEAQGGADASPSSPDEMGNKNGNNAATQVEHPAWGWAPGSLHAQPAQSPAGHPGTRALPQLARKQRPDSRRGPGCDRGPCACPPLLSLPRSKQEARGPAPASEGAP